MENLLKTVFVSPKEDVEVILEILLSPDNADLVSSQERDCFTYIQKVIEITGSVPTEDYFLANMPEYTLTLSRVKAFNPKDLKPHLMMVLEKKRTQNAVRTLMKAASDLSNNGFSDEISDTVASVLKTTAKDSTVDYTKDSASMKDFYNRAKSKPPGLSSSINDIDNVVGSLPYGGVSVILGFTGQGKSLFGCNVMYHNYINLDRNIVIISLEVPKEDVMNNLLCRHSYTFGGKPIPAQSVKFCKLKDDEFDHLYNVVGPDFIDNRPKKNKLIVLDETDFKTMSFTEIRNKLEEIDDALLSINGYGIDAVMVDHIGLLNFAKASESNKSAGAIINEYVSFFRKLSIAFRKPKGSDEWRKIHVLLLAQANREGKKRADKNEGVYDLQSISDANEIERAAQVIMSIWSDASTMAAGHSRLSLLKNRNGPLLTDYVVLKVEAEYYYCGMEDPSLMVATSYETMATDEGMDFSMDLGGMDMFGSI